MTRKFNAILLLMLSMVLYCCQEKAETLAPEAVGPLPSKEQMDWHEMELNAFVHFTINTFTGKEWGYGDESPELFNPTNTDVDQWIRVFKDAGFKGVILTCKHHDGFTLWPSKYTEHSIAQSPYKNGEGDLVKEVSEACKKYGLKFGVYLSPWDRNHPAYGSPEYITYYRNQLNELFTNYGEVFEMWFDGANGGDGYYGGANEVRNIDRETYYDWKGTLDMVSEIQPQVLFFSDAGPDLRWVGNEKGIAGKTNWNTITPDTLYAGKADISELLQSGSEEGTAWIPAEVDVSIRPGWFYHAEEDSLVKTPEELFEIYLTSVGRGSTLLLNIPPDRRGKIHEADVESLRGFRALLDQEFGKNLAKKAKASADSYRGHDLIYSAQKITDEDKSTYWATDDDITKGMLEIDLEKDLTIKYVILQEYIQLGQRVKGFTVEAFTEGEWIQVAEGTTIGYKRILKIDPLNASRIRINISDAQASPLISNVEIY